MKVTGLLLVTLGLVAFAQATKQHDYTLGCTQEEMGIRWPSYVSHSEYYVCPRIGGKQMTITCKAGEVFTYVLQTCTKPSQYIPAPALEQLPIASIKFDGPKVIETVAHPPIVSEVKPPVFEIPVMKPQQPPVLGAEAPKPPVEESKHEAEPIKTEEVQEIVNSGKPPMSIAGPPMPPTPAPTPPVVEPVESVKPAKTLGNKNKAPGLKKSSTKPSKNGKKTPTKTGKTTKTDKNSQKNTKLNSKTSTAKKSTGKKTLSKKTPTQA